MPVMAINLKYLICIQPDYRFGRRCSGNIGRTLGFLMGFMRTLSMAGNESIAEDVSQISSGSFGRVPDIQRDLAD